LEGRLHRNLVVASPFRRKGVKGAISDVEGKRIVIIIVVVE
jgi:hypothetical protein